MPARRLTDTHLIIAAGVLTAVLGGTAALIEGPASQGGGGASSFSAAGTGAKAAYATLSQLGHRIERSYEPMTAITAEPPATILIVTGPLRPSDQDRRALQSFLERGGTALLVGAQGADFLQADGAGDALPFTAAAMHRVLVPSPLAMNASDITMIPAASPPKFGPSYVSVFAMPGGEPLVATAHVGNGRAIWWASPTPLTNAHIADAGNLQLLLNIAGVPGERRLIWDEHYHGYSRTLWSYVAGTPLPWIGAYAVFAVLALFAGYARRRGPVRAKAVDPRTSPLEFIDMLGALYKRAGAHGAAVSAARARLRRVTASACGIPVDSPDEAIARAVSSNTGIDPEEVHELLKSSARAQNAPDLTPANALKLIQQLQRMASAQTVD